MNELPQQLVNGLLLGAMYGLVAIGYTMVYGIVQLINFAHGEIFMTGGFGALTVWLWLPSGTTMWLALPLMIVGAIVVAVTIAVGAERFAYRPLRGGPRLAPLITAIGLSLALQQAVWAWYPDAKSARTFPEIPGGPFELGDVTIQTGDIFLLCAAPLSMAFLAYFVMKTRTGRGMQATAQDPDTAKLMGVNTDRIIVLAFALGATFAAVGAVAYGLKYGQIDFKMGFLLGLKAFTAAVLGGIGNIYGAMIGGVVLGIAETLTTAYVADIPGMDKFGSQSWADVWAFVLLILVLLFRPQGLLGERVADRA
ncbi:branched-chain amino acid ABC transporter permease [Streptomyces acidiscabies]|uniref:Branched-chain amino acid ABC transporter permease n=1 Tax=Streptomyces acidiscabies TaxID=42234 RepID=A0AAP6B647_9ACTN|nr:branched-chain amino acid ABC transporter permease [Streptomyces acidiscabies]MBZ3911509.1 branched-chain amino acid ABC transporter permease [Streptomyces acidiscabies]MDX2958733.1 branched-chain amino acid ABC transporter permease [Streptomyces acidiscabies]MDX3018171.1 branched-chain amino acid ABC transporter permease [Streptomyces acidiscabies]MDX3791568.1 branched-chain amino acid ABC transporter permease [Streptomyces acidiscabies]GAQ55447.1 high-affinity branched-chain amino acid tr